jgi:hypothetical protein
MAEATKADLDRAVADLTLAWRGEILRQRRVITDLLAAGLISQFLATWLGGWAILTLLNRGGS